MTAEDTLENKLKRTAGFPHQIDSSPAIIKMAVSLLINKSVNFAVTVDPTNNQAWTLWLDDRGFRILEVAMAQ